MSADRTLGETLPAQPDQGAGGPRVRLLVYWPRSPDARSRLIELAEGAEVTFGRSRTASVHIDSDQVSRVHASVTRRDGEVVVADLGSRNGTRVNGALLSEPTALRSGDEIEIGPVAAVVSMTSAPGTRPLLGTVADLEERLTAEADRGLRYRRPFSLLMIRLLGTAAAVDQAVDRLARDLRPMDTLVEYGPDELAALLPEADRSGAEEAGARLLATLGGDGSAARERTDVKIGVAVFPVHGSRAGALLSSARAALRAARRTKDALVVAGEPREEEGAGGPVAVDPAMQRTLELARRVADHPMTVLITGETGAGKEVVAEEIHGASRRRKQPLLRLNCASIPETLLESALFGHERGAFTGADRQKAGYFEAADGGTLFLDEIGEISPPIQAKLLRVLEEHRFSRIGATREIQVDVRVVCATNRNLEEEVERGRFREDLYYRISGFSLVVPPLRDRPKDVGPLAEHFARQAAGEIGIPVPRLAPAAVAALETYAWPGNARELKNAIERAVVLQSSGLVQVEDLPERVRDAGGVRSAAAEPAAAEGLDIRDQLARVERKALVTALESAGGNQTRAAQELGLSRRAFIYKLEKYGLKPRPGA